MSKSAEQKATEAKALQDRFDAMTEDSFRAQVIAQIEHLMIGELEAFNKPFPADHKPVGPLKFADILGGSDVPYWWRLYINPMDWDAAEAFAKNAPKKGPQILPGQFYDKDDVNKTGNKVEAAKIFRGPMTTAYNKYLIKGTLNQHFMSIEDPMNWERYLQLWKDATPQAAVFIERPDHLMAKLDATKTLAEDTWKEKITVDGKTYALVRYFGQSGLALVEKVSEKTSMLLSEQSMELLHEAVDQIFKIFREDIDAAKSRGAQLKAIARVVRNIHMIHTFSDGCGRTNVFLLLPIMLLEFGFGLPLGGEHGSGITRDALHMMFNGGYSIDQMAHYLWLTQDFGLLSLNKKLTSIAPLVVPKPVPEPKSGSQNSTGTKSPTTTKPTTKDDPRAKPKPDTKPKPSSMTSSPSTSTSGKKPSTSTPSKPDKKAPIESKSNAKAGPSSKPKPNTNKLDTKSDTKSNAKPDTKPNNNAEPAKKSEMTVKSESVAQPLKKRPVHMSHQTSHPTLVLH